ncbi:hypothetical protein A7W90_17235 [Clostridium sp. Bc-iso-3]|nr:hypothetical protein A7W90_17235 [Clostridium sp. Bc-iso-3]
MELREEKPSNFFLGILGGFVAALIGAALWAAIAILTGYQIGYVAMGLGALVGLAVKLLGKGSELRFRLAGALLSLFGCILGNVFYIYAYLAKSWGLSFFQVMGTTDLPTTIAYLRLTFSFIDLLFYALALYVGFRMSSYER